MTAMKYASSPTKSAASPSNETTRLSALATGLRFATTATPNTSVKIAKRQKRMGDIRLLFRVPLMHKAIHHSAEFIELGLVVFHLRPRSAGDRVVFAQEDRLLGADFFAQATVDASDHVDLEFLRAFFDPGKLRFRGNFLRLDGNRSRRADELA